MLDTYLGCKWNTVQYIRNSVIQERVIKSPDRAGAERFYPYAAIEEGLCNAVYHMILSVIQENP